MKKPIRFTEYALRKIAGRKISLDEVVGLLRSDAQVIPDFDDPNREIYQIQIRSRRGKLLLLRTVVEESADEILVVTAYVTTQIKKYWREQQ